MTVAISRHLLAAVIVLGVAACGRGSDDTLADGATDRPTTAPSTGSAEDIGPPSPSSAAASPAGGRTGMDSSTGSAAPGAGSPAAGAATLGVAPGAEAYVVDGAGAPLYALQGDRTGDTCTGECLRTWTPLVVTGAQPTGAAGLAGAMISTVPRADGAQQVSYGGMPLYRYAGKPMAADQARVTDAYGTWVRVPARGAATQ